MCHPAASRDRISDQPQPAKVQLALHPRLPISHPHRRPPAAKSALLDGEAVQCPVGHHHPAPGQLAVDVHQLQPVIDPGPDPLPLPLTGQRLPRRTVPRRPHRTHRSHHHTQQLITQLGLTTVADQPGLLPRGHITPGGLAVHPRPLRRPAQPVTGQPGPQHLPNLDHMHLPVHHAAPPDHSTRSDQ